MAIHDGNLLRIIYNLYIWMGLIMNSDAVFRFPTDRIYPFQDRTYMYIHKGIMTWRGEREKY